MSELEYFIQLMEIHPDRREAALRALEQPEQHAGQRETPSPT